MGQYFRPILGDEYGLNCKVFDRSVDGEYTLAKLLEHAWWGNSFVNAFSEFLYKEPSRVAWTGDYADEPDDFNFPNCSAFSRIALRSTCLVTKKFGGKSLFLSALSLLISLSTASSCSIMIPSNS